MPTVTEVLGALNVSIIINSCACAGLSSVITSDVGKPFATGYVFVAEDGAGEWPSVRYGSATQIPSYTGGAPEGSTRHTSTTRTSPTAVRSAPRRRLIEPGCSPESARSR